MSRSCWACGFLPPMCCSHFCFAAIFFVVAASIFSPVNCLTQRIRVIAGGFGHTILERSKAIFWSCGFCAVGDVEPRLFLPAAAGIVASKTRVIARNRERDRVFKQDAGLEDARNTRLLSTEFVNSASPCDSYCRNSCSWPDPLPTDNFAQTRAADGRSNRSSGYPLDLPGPWNRKRGADP